MAFRVRNHDSLREVHIHRVACLHSPIQRRGPDGVFILILQLELVRTDALGDRDAMKSLLRRFPSNKADGVRVVVLKTVVPLVPALLDETAV